MGSFPRTVPLRTELPAAARGFLGHVTDIRVPQVYDGRPGQFGGHELDRYFGAMAYPMPNPWGSAQVDDPLQARIGTVPTLALVGAIRGNLAQRLGRVPSMTWRLQQSRAYLGIEVHCRDMVCAAVRYQSTPASHRRTVERLNGALGTSYPVDMPLDAIGALTGFRWQTEQTLARHLGADAPADQLAATVQVLAALRHDDLAATVRLREYARHPAPQVRRAVAAAALWYGNLFLATEVMLSEPDPAARAELGDLIAVGGYGPDTYNAFNDYFDDVPVLLDDADEPVGTWSDSDQNGDEA